ncbi:hypothetical protein J4231_02530, partial [Candidatus Woesearchaeota archaeon]|nr:hypothetical protein [Candidatus Woesearchaeota archaeon]
TTTATSSEFTGPFIGIENDFVYDDASDNPPGVGDCIDLPNNYISICYDSLTVSDDKYATYTFEMDTSTDLDQAGLQDNLTGVSTLYIHTPVNEGLVIDVANFDNNGTSNTDIKTDKIWLWANVDDGGTNGLGGLLVFYSDTNNKVRVAGNISNASSSAQAFHINYGSTKDNDILVNVGGDTGLGSGDDMNVTVRPYEATDQPGYNDNITMQWRFGAAGGITSLGATASSEEAGEVRWEKLSTGDVAIGTKDEDHRGRYGIIIRDQKSHGSSDSVVLDIPADIVRANIVVKGRASTTTSGSGETCTPAEVNPVTLTDDQVTDPTKYNLILVGGPRANPLVETLNFGITSAGWSFKDGEAVIKLANNGDKVAMLVAGTQALDTQRAAKVVANYKNYKLENTEVLVTGTTLSDITVKNL